MKLNGLILWTNHKATNWCIIKAKLIKELQHGCANTPGHRLQVFFRPM